MVPSSHCRGPFRSRTGFLTRAYQSLQHFWPSSPFHCSDWETRQIQTEQGWERVGHLGSSRQHAVPLPPMFTKQMSQYSNQHSLLCGYKWVSHLEPRQSAPQSQGRCQFPIPPLKLVDTMGVRATRPMNKHRHRAK